MTKREKSRKRIYYVTHRDQYGERQQIGDPFEARNPTDALYTILEQAGAEDDGNYEVFEGAKGFINHGNPLKTRPWESQ